MFVAGISVSDDDVVELARLVHPELADRLQTAVDRETTMIGLTIAERTEILAALDGPPDGLAELRGVLLREHEWPLAHGLV